MSVAMVAPTVYPEDKDNVLTIKTIQTTPIRGLFGAIKDIIVQTNITFSPEGIRIIDMDDSQVILIYVLLEAAKFQLFSCTKNKIIIAVNMTHLCRLINIMENNDVFTMYISNKDYNDGAVKHLSLRYENGEIKQCRTYKLRLAEPDTNEIVYPSIIYSSVINFPSQDFQKIIRDLAALADRVEIKSAGSDLFFSAIGTFCNAEIVRSEAGEDNMTFTRHTNTITQGVFLLKNLGYFIKCTNLCSQIEIHLENDMPFVAIYKVSTMGIIKLCLAQLPPLT